jgi:NAD(P)-dependent dehydrogenase (short-subunit alcohol dehydrogenase family)
MVLHYWPIAAIAVVIAVVTFGLPWIVAEYFPWRNLYNQRHGRPTVVTPSYKDRTALITGANGAYGSRAAKLFAHRDIETLVLVDVKDCTGIKEEIEAELKERKKPIPTILVWQVDMFSYADCQALAKKASALKSIDHALMTAGILAFDRHESPEGWETCKLPTNYFGIFSLFLVRIKAH